MTAKELEDALLAWETALEQIELALRHAKTALAALGQQGEVKQCQLDLAWAVSSLNKVRPLPIVKIHDLRLELGRLDS